MRSRKCPSGFGLREAAGLHTQLARRIAFIGMLALQTGCYFSCEQPGSSVMFHMHCFRLLVSMGCVVSRLAFCNFGSGFNKSSQWLHNKPWLVDLEGNCQCPFQGKHFTVSGTFAQDRIIQAFDLKCRPHAAGVYGRLPRIGESVAAYAAQYPLPLMRRMAAGSALAKAHGARPMPFQKQLESCLAAGVDFPFAPLQIGSDVECVPRPDMRTQSGSASCVRVYLSGNSTVLLFASLGISMCSSVVL